MEHKIDFKGEKSANQFFMKKFFRIQFARDFYGGIGFWHTLKKGLREKLHNCLSELQCRTIKQSKSSLNSRKNSH